MLSKGLRFAANNAVGFLALFIALGGVGYAATGGFTSSTARIQACAGSGGTLKLLTGKKCGKGQKKVAWNQQGVAGAPGATGPSGIAGLNGAAVPNATNAINATNATNATTAANALSLGGIPADEFTRSDCSSETGQVKGYGQVAAQAPFNYTEIEPAYNCSGEGVEARRNQLGQYFIRFPGNPSEVPLVTVIGTGPVGERTAKITRVGPESWRVDVNDSEKQVDEKFSVVLF